MMKNYIDYDEEKNLIIISRILDGKIYKIVIPGDSLYKEVERIKYLSDELFRLITENFGKDKK